MAQRHMGWGIVEEVGWRKGPWTAEEDRLLIEYVNLHGEGRWNNVATLAGLKRHGKSCRLRWVNYLRPDLKRGRITPHEETIILQLHAIWGNRWSTIARSLPGRTDNEIKNYWRTHFKKRGKPPTQNAEKTRARLLKRQQFFHQQQQQQRQQQEDQLNLNKINSSPSGPDEQGMYYYSMRNGCETVGDMASDEDVAMWDGLWNLDDHIHLHGSATYHHHTIASAFY